VPKLEFTLPVAPPANNLFFNAPGRGRIKTTRYRDWIKLADDYYLLQALQRREKITVPFACKMTFPKNLRGDIDGRIKAVLDWMVSRNLTIDDKHCKKLLVEYGGWSDSDVDDVVQIEVTTYVKDGEPGKGPAE
jgi:Holliday junction resolvase RusA-like endonuclease